MIADDCDAMTRPETDTIGNEMLKQRPRKAELRRIARIGNAVIKNHRDSDRRKAGLPSHREQLRCKSFDERRSQRYGRKVWEMFLEEEGY